MQVSGLSPSLSFDAFGTIFDDEEFAPYRLKRSDQDESRTVERKRRYRTRRGALGPAAFGT